MPVKTPSKKATSPSPSIQKAVNNSWGKQVGTTDPKQALSQKYTRNPVKVSNGGN